MTLIIAEHSEEHQTSDGVCYVERVMEVDHPQGAYYMTLRMVAGFSTIWKLYEEANTGVAASELQGVTKAQSLARFTSNGVWGFVIPTSLTIWFAVSPALIHGSDMHKCETELAAFFAHEVDHILRPAENILESEQNAVITGDCARLAVVATHKVMAHMGSRR